MTVKTGLNTTLRKVEAHDEGMVIIPFGCTINGTSDPDAIVGDLIASVTRSEAGEFEFTLKRRPARCYFAVAGVSNTADDKDELCRVDWSSVESAGTFKVYVQVGATQTDPGDDLLLGGVLYCKKTTRRARNSA